MPFIIEIKSKYNYFIDPFYVFLPLNAKNTSREVGKNIGTYHVMNIRTLFPS